MLRSVLHYPDWFAHLSRSSVDRLQTKLQSVERENKELSQKVTSLQLSLGSATSQSEDLKTMNERSSSELKKALEVVSLTHLTCPCSLIPSNTSP